MTEEKRLKSAAEIRELVLRADEGGYFDEPYNSKDLRWEDYKDEVVRLSKELVGGEASDKAIEKAVRRLLMSTLLGRWRFRRFA